MNHTDRYECIRFGSMPAAYNPQATRQALLDAAFHEIHRKGFQAASMTEILARTGVTKGALYHHFPTKRHLGLAVIDEVIADRVLADWLEAPSTGGGVIDSLIARVKAAAAEATPETVALGCPLNNLAQEMSPIDDEFRAHLCDVFTIWQRRLAEAIAEGQNAGEVRPDIDPTQTATFFIAAVEGSIGAIKASRRPDVIEACVAGLIHYLGSLKAR